MCLCIFFFFKQKTAYEMRISDWSSDVCSSDLNCNLRCPFCLVDYTNIRTTNRMSEETFRKWIQIMPIVQDGSFFISCLHEATLHPRLYDFIDLIPDQLRKKVFFTSNLCKPLTDTEIESMARSDIHPLNISLDFPDYRSAETSVGKRSVKKCRS